MRKFIAALLAVLFAANFSVAFAESDDIARLYTFTSGTTIQSSQVNGEFNQLVNSMNEKAGRAVNQTMSGDNTFSGANTFSGINTFTSGTTPIKVDSIDENSSAVGVTIDGLLIKDSVLTPSVTSDPGTPAEGNLWYNSTSNTVKFYDGSATQSLLTTANLDEYPPEYINGAEVLYATNATATISVGQVRNIADDLNIDITASRTCNITTSGAGGLDTGSEAADTWYYVYVIDDSTAVNTEACLLSTTNEASSGTVTMPSGYDEKRQLPMAIRNDSSSHFIPWYIGAGWPYRPQVIFDVQSSSYDAGSDTAGATQVLNAGTSSYSTFADVSLSSFQPGISEMAYIKVWANSAYVHLRKDGSTHIGISVGQTDAQFDHYAPFWMETSSQTIEYAKEAAGTDVTLDVMGFVVTEL